MSERTAERVELTREQIEESLRELCRQIRLHGDRERLASAEIIMRELGLWRP